jgi:hypothetical protein
MRAELLRTISCKALILGVLCLSAPGLARSLDRSTMVPSASAARWESSAYRNFGAPETIWAGRAEVRDEAQDPALTRALGTEFKRLALELHEKQGWRVPLADGDPLRILIARKEADGVRRVASRSIERGLLVSPAIQLDATGLSTRQIVHEVSRLYAFATLTAYGATDRTFLTAAAADYLAGDADEEDREAALASAAAPEVDLSAHPSALGRLYVEEFAREAGGPAALRAVWERAAETRGEPLEVLLKAFSETTQQSEDALLLRFAARLYATFETEPAPSRVSLADLQMGSLDAATPPVFALRHRVFLPAPDGGAGALRIAWPEQGSDAAAVVRYRDSALPPDVLFLEPGSAHTIPLSGVARVDFVVAGSTSGPPLSGAAALVEPLAAFPFAGLTAQALAGPGGPRISWTTAAHESLAGWAIFREEVLSDGRIARFGPEMVPSSNSGEESFRYVYLDPATSPATFYRYTIWAVTVDGLLARAFSATLHTAE